MSPVCMVFSRNIRKADSPALAAVEEVVADSELTAALKQVWKLQRLLGKKTMEVGILKEAVEYGQSRQWIAPAPLVAKGREIVLASRGISHAQQSLQVNLSAGWQDRRRNQCYGYR